MLQSEGPHIGEYNNIAWMYGSEEKGEQYVTKAQAIRYAEKAVELKKLMAFCTRWLQYKQGQAFHQGCKSGRKSRNEAVIVERM